MSEILHQKNARAATGTARIYKAEVTELDFGIGNRETIVKLIDGKSGPGLCLGCNDTPCMKKHKDESKLPSAFEAFPGDPSTDVCPTKALSWDEKAEAIQVAGADCIGCGLCIARCPYGALHLADGKKARVALKDGAGLLKPGKPDGQVRQHPKPSLKGRIAPSVAPALKHMDEAVKALNDAQALLLVRNVLHEIGVQCRIRRRGDTNVRIDAIVALESGQAGVVEIEFVAPLESPRALLEDIAVLHSRYAMPRANIVPVSIILSLPNARSEYYQVIDDIQRVIDIRCHTITVGALLILLWNFGRLAKLDGKLFVTANGGADFFGSLAAVLGKSFKLDGEPYIGATHTAK